MRWLNNFCEVVDKLLGVGRHDGVAAVVAVAVDEVGRSAPLLDDRPGDLGGVDPGDDADLLGHVDALLLGQQRRHDLGGRATALLRTQLAILLGDLLHDLIRNQQQEV